MTIATGAVKRGLQRRVKPFSEQKTGASGQVSLSFSAPTYRPGHEVQPCTNDWANHGSRN